MNDQTYTIALQPGYQLHWYVIEKVLGQGAFGITYLADDVNLERKVAIKEYLPGQFSVRDENLTVKPTSSVQKEDFDWGLKRFISEAKTLTKFEHANLVRVFNVFELNNTAYMVMNYELGKSLQQILKSRNSLREDEAKRILFPLMSGLEIMHSKGFVHRDIKPGNIFIRNDGSPVLLDFGSARQTRSSSDRAGGDDPKTLTALVSPGYAPIEQYGSKSDRQGAWTDIYGLGATLYRSITGVMPIAAVDRSEAIIHDSKDPYLPISKAYKDKYSQEFLNAIDHAMAFKAQDRPQSIADWRKDFGIGVKSAVKPKPQVTKSEEDVPTVKAGSADVATQKIDQAPTVKVNEIDSDAKTEKATVKVTTSGSSWLTKFLVGGAVICVVIIGAMFMLSGGDEKQKPAPKVSKAPEPVTPVAPVETVTAPEPEPEPEPEPDINEINQEKIQELLHLAEQDKKKLRLTSPKDNNAFDKYLAVLELEENNEAALAGIQSIADTYISLAHSAMNKDQLNHAASYLKKAAAIAPDSQRLADAKQTLKSKRAAKREAIASQPEQQQQQQTTEQTTDTASTEPEEENESFWNKVKDWHQENVEKGEQYKKEHGESTEEKLRKTLGGQ